MKTTRYFREQVLRKRPYIDPAWCAQIVAAPLRREEQPDGRVRLWEIRCARNPYFQAESDVTGRATRRDIPPSVEERSTEPRMVTLMSPAIDYWETHHD